MKPLAATMKSKVPVLEPSDEPADGFVFVTAEGELKDPRGRVPHLRGPVHARGRDANSVGSVGRHADNIVVAERVELHAGDRIPHPRSKVRAGGDDVGAIR